MDQSMVDQLPQVQLYAIGPEEVDFAAPLLTAEAQTYIRQAEAFGLALAEDGELRAAACARLRPENETVLELISLYVAPAFRRRALGGTMLMELLEEAMEATDGSLRWVTASFSQETEGMEALLSQAGFCVEADETAVSWQLTVGELADSPLMARAVTLPAGHVLYPLQKLSGYHIRQLVQVLKGYRVDDLSAQEMRQAHPGASHVLYDRNSQPVACAVFTVQGGARVTLSQFFTAGASPAPAMAVLQAGAKALLEQLPGESLLEIPTLTDSSAKLLKKLVPASRAVPLMKATLDLRGF